MNRALLRLAVARLLSYAGSEAALIALLYSMYDSTGSTMMTSLTLVASVGVLGAATLAMGGLGDRFDRRRVMVGSDLCAGAVFGLLLFAESSFAVLALVALASVAVAPFLSTSQSAVAHIAPDDASGRANALIVGSWKAGLLLGPIIGGLMLELSNVRLVYAFNVVTFAASALLIGGVRTSLQDAPTTADGDASVRRTRSRRPTAGRFIMRDPTLRPLLVAYVIALVGIGGISVAELPLLQSLDAGAAWFGIVNAGFGLGTVLGALAGGHIVRSRQLHALAAAFGLTGVGLVLIGVTPIVQGVLVGMFMVGICDGVIDVVQQIVVQRRAPTELLSRVIACFHGVALLSMTASFLITGAVAAHVRPDTLFFLAAATCMAVGAYLGLSYRTVAAVERDEPPHAEGPEHAVSVHVQA